MHLQLLDQLLAVLVHKSRPACLPGSAFFCRFPLTSIDNHLKMACNDPSHVPHLTSPVSRPYVMKLVFVSSHRDQDILFMRIVVRHEKPAGRAKLTPVPTPGPTDGIT
jgi:hypothetical protein